jgi:hypothetical protein
MAVKTVYYKIEEGIAPSSHDNQKMSNEIDKINLKEKIL